MERGSRVPVSQEGAGSRLEAQIIIQGRDGGGHTDVAAYAGSQGAGSYPLPEALSPRKPCLKGEAGGPQTFLSRGDDYLVYLLDIPWFGNLFDPFFHF